MIAYFRPLTTRTTSTLTLLGEDTSTVTTSVSEETAAAFEPGLLDSMVDSPTSLSDDTVTVTLTSDGIGDITSRIGASSTSPIRPLETATVSIADIALTPQSITSLTRGSIELTSGRTTFTPTLPGGGGGGSIGGSALGEISTTRSTTAAISSSVDTRTSLPIIATATTDLMLETGRTGEIEEGLKLSKSEKPIILLTVSKKLYEGLPYETTLLIKKFRSERYKLIRYEILRKNIFRDEEFSTLVTLGSVDLNFDSRFKNILERLPYKEIEVFTFTDKSIQPSTVYAYRLRLEFELMTEEEITSRETSRLLALATTTPPSSIVFRPP